MDVLVAAVCDVCQNFRGFCVIWACLFLLGAVNYMTRVH